MNTDNKTKFETVNALQEWGRDFRDKSHPVSLTLFRAAAIILADIQIEKRNDQWIKRMNENETPETDKFANVGQEWRGVPSHREWLDYCRSLGRERNQLRWKNETLLDAKIKAENAECLVELTVGMMEQDIETIRKIITKGGTAADVLKFLDTPNA